MKTIYIAGPMTGLPEFNYPAFFDAEERLREQGFLIKNPATGQKHPNSIVEDDEVWRYYMRQGIRMLLESDEIALLPGWMDSRGAKLEYFIAQNLGMHTWDYRDGELSMMGARPPLDALAVTGATMPAGGV
jgi:hypothetical protein